MPRSSRSISALIATLALVTACSSKPKTESPTAASEAKASSAATTRSSEAQILDKYSLEELNGAAIAISAASAGAGAGAGAGGNAAAQEPGAGACFATGQVGASHVQTLQSLIERKAHVEREEYANDPATFARTRGFETCASRCACGVYAKVLEAIDPSSLRQQTYRSRHRRSLQRMKAKAARQTSEDTQNCARKQTWYCESPLRAYVEQGG